MTAPSLHAGHAEINDELLEVVDQSYGLQIKVQRLLEGGEESKNFLATTSAGNRVIRIGPSWRTSAELEWSYALAAHAATQTAEPLAPCPTCDGKLVTRSADRPLSIWPFVAGRHPDLESPADRSLAAAVLARLHRSLASWTGRSRRPATSPNAPVMRRPRRDPEMLGDSELDGWLEEWRRSRNRLIAPIHGDFLSHNLICTESGTARVIDWDDARVGSVERELAWAVWEFCGNPEAGSLDPICASDFLDIYAANRGCVPVVDRSFVVPLIREHLRFEIRVALAARERGGTYSEEYLDAEMRAFLKLRTRTL
jgi:Ser/Thr protein kinase RdoA (MazF antagonist)